MTNINVISVFIMLPLLIIYLFRRFAPQKKNVPGELFAEALRNENSGYFETALINYERALGKLKKIGLLEAAWNPKLLISLKYYIRL